MIKTEREGFVAFINRILHPTNLRFLVKKPLLLLRVAKLAFKYAVLNKNVPWEANLSIVTSCNLNCRHCFASTFSTTATKTDGKKQLSTEEIIAVIKENLDLGIINFQFQGGEVLLHPDLEKIVKAAEPHRSYIHLVTNGILFDEACARKLKKWGVDQISVSIDSYIPEAHDNLRNMEGVWQKAMEAIMLAKRYHFVPLVLTTVTHETLQSEGIKRLNNFCLENGITNWLLIGIPVGSWLGRTDILIDDDDHMYMEELAKKTKNRIRRDLSPHLFRSGCPAVKESYYMTPYGDVMPCPFIPISLGNIRESSIKDILDRGVTIKEFREYWPVCLIGQDTEFINKYGKKLFISNDAPTDGDEILPFKNPLPKRSRPLTS